MEIGSFIELDIRDTGEYHNLSQDVLRLNSARAGIYHACRLYKCESIYIPFYQCPTVSDFLIRKGIKVEYYSINEQFEPQTISQKGNSAYLVVNYFGILSIEKIKKIASNFKNVIIDNSAAFYIPPQPNCANVYSTRKFFGVPDGCYVIAPGAEQFSEEYSLDFSSDTATFLLKRIEYGCSAAYSERMINEARIDRSDIMLMSSLTSALLKGIDYNGIARKRKKNFEYAHNLFKDINLIDPMYYIGSDNVAMVYPLVFEQKSMVDKLREEHVYTGRWWKSVLNIVPTESFESLLSNYMIPIPIDQRYGYEEIDKVLRLIKFNIHAD